MLELIGKLKNTLVAWKKAKYRAKQLKSFETHWNALIELSEISILLNQIEVAFDDANWQYSESERLRIATDTLAQNIVTYCMGVDRDAFLPVVRQKYELMVV